MIPNPQRPVAAGDMVFVGHIGWRRVQQACHHPMTGQFLGVFVIEAEALLPVGECICWWLPDDRQPLPHQLAWKEGSA